MVGPEPTGASVLTMAPVVSTPADNSTEQQGPVSKNDVFGDIKNKFLNEMDKLPRECMTIYMMFCDIIFNFNFSDISTVTITQASNSAQSFRLFSNQMVHVLPRCALASTQNFLAKP